MSDTADNTSGPDRSPTWLLDHASNVYSQAGEDGIFAKMLDMLPETDRWCVEFGAWDGKHFCNARNLIEQRNYHAVLIEGDGDKARELATNYAGNAKVITQHQFVGFTKDNNLGHILKDTPIPSDFDLLVIDIDGNDYHVWQAFDTYRPKIVAIEFNPTIPNEVAYVQPADPAISRGSSLKALVALASEKGYELICVLPFNAFFVQKEFFPLFGIDDNRPETLRTDTSLITYLFSGYDGTVMLSGANVLPWHKMTLDASRLQMLPRRLRKFPDSYSGLQRWWVRHVVSPRALPRRVARRLFGRRK